MFTRVNQFFEKRFSRLLGSKPSPNPVRVVRRVGIDDSGKPYTVVVPVDGMDEGTEIQLPVHQPLRLVR